MPNLPFDIVLQSTLKSSAFKEAISNISSNSITSIKGIPDSLKGTLVSSFFTFYNSQIVIVCLEDKADELYHDCSVLLGSENVCIVRKEKRRSKKNNDESTDIEVVDAVTTIQKNPSCVVICPINSLLLGLPDPVDITKNHWTLSQGQKIGFETVTETLILNGFERQDFVAKPGDIAVRGGIIDVFPVGCSTPLRFEFWGDEIESIREFDPLSQRSIREHSKIEFLSKFFNHGSSTQTASIRDYISSQSIVIFDSKQELESELYKLNPELDLSLLVKFKSIELNSIGSQKSIEFSVQDIPDFETSVEKFYRHLTELYHKKYSVVICSEGAVNNRRIKELLDNVADRIEEEDPEFPHPLLHKIHWITSTLHKGFVWESEKIAVFTEHQLFNRLRFRDSKKYQNSKGITLRDLQQLRKGDLIVHIDKGVGQFEGLETIDIGGSKQESVKLSFDGGDALYVHLNYINKLQRYSAQDGTIPKLSKLGSGDWERKKARTKKKLKDIARDLIKLYALRKSQQGFAYPVDTVWQKEFEASFMYEDTPDQSKATAEIKDDMESPVPMDRLVCGDVGFGKTEVAIRSAFKAAQAGRQVAVLVPTTILAQQHYLTFSERMQRYPVRVDVLSRFRTKEQQQVILENVKEGKVDVLVGTHRLLSKDVKFKDLGLLIVDEEQRFGVGAKEKLRQMRTNIDTLTLTATPIPRTLNFSLMGARDLSIMETPPRNRLPVETVITEFDDDLLRQAILDELDRDGQIYFVNDRIEDMDALAMKLVELVPGLKFGIAHGQMDSEKLENVMERFLERKFDVLLATKIVESGLDIPNVNTIIIHRAQNFGLAELYQLRGRVGRSNKQASCYLVVPTMKSLSRTALKRLQAIEEFTDLGSGFNLALRDMEIRGAGNLLGAEQSGFILEMGFEMYHKILDEAVKELRVEEFSDIFGETEKVSFDNEDISIELDTDALIPDTYIRKDTERFEFYKRLYNVETESGLSDIISELRDRFGNIPVQVEELIFAVRLRMNATHLGFSRVIVRGRNLQCELPENAHERYYQKAFPIIAATLAGYPNTRFFQKGKKTFVEIVVQNRNDSIVMFSTISAELRKALS